MFENLQNEKNTPNQLARYNTPKCVTTLNFIGVGLMNTQLVEKQTYFWENIVCILPSFFSYGSQSGCQVFNF